jgi:hypothetical protein
MTTCHNHVTPHVLPPCDTTCHHHHMLPPPPPCLTTTTCHHVSPPPCVTTTWHHMSPTRRVTTTWHHQVSLSPPPRVVLIITSTRREYKFNKFACLLLEKVKSRALPPPGGQALVIYYNKWIKNLCRFHSFISSHFMFTYLFIYLFMYIFIFHNILFIFTYNII